MDYHVLKFDSSGNLLAAFYFADEMSYGAVNAQADANGQLYVIGMSTVSGSNGTDAVIASDWSSVSYSNDIASGRTLWMWVDRTATGSDPVLYSLGRHGTLPDEYSAQNDDLSTVYDAGVGEYSGSYYATFGSYGQNLYYRYGNKVTKVDSSGSVSWEKYSGTDFFDVSPPLPDGYTPQVHHAVGHPDGVVVGRLTDTAYFATKHTLIALLAASDGSLQWEVRPNNDKLPIRIAVDTSNGDIFVLCYSLAFTTSHTNTTDRIQRFNSSGTFQNDIATNAIDGLGLWVDDNSKVYCFSKDMTQWTRYSASGTLELSVDIPHDVSYGSRQVPPLGGSWGHIYEYGPRHIAVDGDGNVYVCSGPNTIPSSYSGYDYIT